MIIFLNKNYFFNMIIFLISIIFINFIIKSAIIEKINIYFIKRNFML